MNETQMSCSYHPNVKSVAICLRCEKPICKQCLVMQGKNAYCIRCNDEIHTEQAQHTVVPVIPSTPIRKRHGYLFSIAFIVGLPWACLMFFGGLMSGYMVPSGEFTYFYMLLIAPALIFIISIALAFKWALISGVVLIVVSLYVMIMATVIEQGIIDPLALLPFPIVGTLYILDQYISWGK